MENPQQLSLDQPSSSTLPADILYIVAGELLFTRQPKGKQEVDLCHQQNGFTNFMRLNLLTRNAFLSQFTKIKQIEFGPDGIKMYSNYGSKNGTFAEDSSPSSSSSFHGWFRVTRSFVRMLVLYRKLNLATITTNHYLIRPIHDAKNNNASRSHQPRILSFCKLFLGKDYLPDEDAADIRFELDKLEVSEPCEVLAATFADLLNLNAESVAVKLEGPLLFDFATIDRSFKAERTASFSMAIDDGPYSMLMMDELIHNCKSLINLLLDSCPNLHLINLDLSTRFLSFFGTSYTPRDVESLMEHLGEIEDKFVGQVLPSLVTGNSTAQIVMELKYLCNFKMHHEEGRIEQFIEECFTREFHAADQLNRIHICIIKILTS